MRIAIQFKTFLIIISTGLLLIGFQNYSKNQISAAEAGFNESLNTDELPDRSNTPLNQPNSPTSGGNAPTGEPVSAAPAPAPAPATAPSPTPTLPPITGNENPRYLCSLNTTSCANIDRKLAEMRERSGDVTRINGLNGKIVILGESTLGTNRFQHVKIPAVKSYFAD